MNDDTSSGHPWPLTTIALAFMVGVLTWVSTSSHYEEAQKEEAVKEGHAVWVAREDGKAEFRWLPTCKPNFLEDKPKERKP